MASINKPGPVIKIKSAVKAFGEVKALNNLDLEVDPGLTFGLLGPNGSGKTTLIRTLVGLIKLDAGQVLVLDEDPTRRHIKSRIGYMTQQTALYQELSVLENLDFFARVYGLGRRRCRERCQELITFVQLEEKANASVAVLSGGMRQRLSLACALIHEPEVLFLDEPTVGIDPTLRIVFWRYFKELNQRGVTIVVSSHVMDEAAKCDRLGLLSVGRVLADGDLKSLLNIYNMASLEDVFIHLSEAQQ